MGILRKAICGRTAQSLNRFYFQNQSSTRASDAFKSPFASTIGNFNGISGSSETNVQYNSLLHAAKSKLSGNVLPTAVRDYATAVESNKFAYYRTMGGNPMIQQFPVHCSSNVRFYSTSSGSAAKTQPKEKSYPTVFWHLHEGIEEIVADYVHHEMTRAWVLIFFRLSLIIVAKDVFLSLVF